MVVGAAMDGVIFSYLYMPYEIDIIKMKLVFVKKMVANILPIDPDVLAKWEAQNKRKLKQ